MPDVMNDPLLFTFRFDVAFFPTQLSGILREDATLAGVNASPIGSGAFSECSGLEATMEPKTIKEGGNNDTPIQRAGTVSYATVILKRGLTANRDLWRAFALPARGAYTQRFDCVITLNDTAGVPTISWLLVNALPVKFKTADFNAKASEVGLEELHLVHEGLYLA